MRSKQVVAKLEAWCEDELLARRELSLCSTCAHYVLGHYTGCEAFTFIREQAAASVPTVLLVAQCANYVDASRYKDKQ